MLCVLEVCRSKYYIQDLLFSRILLTGGFRLCQIVFFGVFGRTYYGYEHNIYLWRIIVLLCSFCRSLKYHISIYNHIYECSDHVRYLSVRFVKGVLFLERRTTEFHTYLTITQCSAI